MRQASINLKVSMNKVNITNNNMEINRVILHAMLFATAGFALLYILILGNMVFDIVARKAVEKEMLTLSTDVGQLELTYLSMSGNLDMAMSSELGFKEIQSTFATRRSLGSLSLALNEI